MKHKGIDKIYKLFIKSLSMCLTQFDDGAFGRKIRLNSKK